LPLSNPGKLQVPHLRLVRVTRRRCASWDAQQTKRSGSEHPPSSFGSSRIAARFELLVFDELKIAKIMGIPRCPPPSLGHHTNGDQSLTIEWNLQAAMFVLSLIGAIPYRLNALVRRLPRVGDREISAGNGDAIGGRARPPMADVECPHFEIVSGGAARSERCDKTAEMTLAAKMTPILSSPNNTLHQTRCTAPKTYDVWSKNRTSLRPAP